MSAKEAYHLFNSANKGLFSDLYDSWAGTIHTSVYFPSSLQAWFTLGPDQEPTVIDFKKWLNGEPIALDRITGTIDTNVPFFTYG